MDIYVTFLYFFSSERKFLKLKNFELLIFKVNKSELSQREESRIHVKYIKINESQDRLILFERTDTREKIKLKTDSDNDFTNLINSINNEKKNYNSFIKDYYTNNDTYNLIEGESFFDYFKSIQSFLSEMEKSLRQLQIDESLKQILTVQNQFLSKISYYTKLVDSNFNQLNNKNNEDENNLLSSSREIKALLEELRDIINSCINGLTCEEINAYIDNFKKLVLEKSKEINLLIDEIKYNLANYLAVKNDNPDDNINDVNRNSKEEELSKMVLENENLKIQIENLEAENDIINLFLQEYK